MRCYSALHVPSPAILSNFCVSTTLATNAMVEGTEKDVCAISIGLTPSRSVDYASETLVIAGRHDPMGEETCPVDMDTLRSKLNGTRMRSFAVSGYFGSRNPEHEKLVAEEVIRMLPGATVVRGSDLAGTLGAEERLFLAAKNAELMHLMSAFIEGIEDATGVPDTITYALRGDGTLVSTEEARLRPIFTVLSGPAASAMGATALAGTRDALVIDIGGTTTDVAVVRKGRVRIASEGARVGGSRLRTGSLDLRTIALGGDTEIFCEDGRAMLGSRAVQPLCLAPDANAMLRDRSFLYQDNERTVGITPTDLFRDQGKSDFGDAAIARAALEALARVCERPIASLRADIEEMIRARLLRVVLSAALGKDLPEGSDDLIKGGGLLTKFTIALPIVGIGAPVRNFLDLIAERVCSEIIIPHDHDVGNAVGAVSTGVYGRKDVIVRSEVKYVDGDEERFFHVTTEEGMRVFRDKDEAVAFASDIGKAALCDYMDRSRVRRYDLVTETREVTYLEHDQESHVETVVTITAEGA